MKRTLCLALCLLTLGLSYADNLFEPYKTSKLRLPSVPLLMSDPFLSIWSTTDKLNESAPAHWTLAPKPLTGLVRVDGVTYRFMGNDDQYFVQPIAPMGTAAPWQADYTMERPAEGWMQPGFKAEGWKQGNGAFGSRDKSGIHTPWSGENTDIWVRRTVKLTREDLAQELVLMYSHDNDMEIYLNGHEVMRVKDTFVDNCRLPLTAAQRAHLHEGENLIAIHCHNQTGGAVADCGLYANTIGQLRMKQAEQTEVDVMATSTYYTFRCGPVELKVAFTAPMVISDLDLLSTPINYMSYQVRALDEGRHTVDLLVAASSDMAVNNVRSDIQPVRSERLTVGGQAYLKTGTIEQPILQTALDHACIDWGYFYLTAPQGQLSLGAWNSQILAFANQGTLPAGEAVTRQSPAALCWSTTLRDVTKPQQGFIMLGYDDILCMQYLYRQYPAYWTHGGKVSITDAFRSLQKRYAKVMAQCRAMDKTIWDDAYEAGGQKYAELLSASYRHVMAAHKLFQDDEGHLLYFSKENDSNGSVNTVDLTYPEAPLYLVYNLELQKAMMTSIFEYAKSGRWTKPFAAHDMGTYPKANGQTYGGDMPLEESANMIILTAQICMQEGHSGYADPYWEQLTLWKKYLEQYGQDPADQLCTDDFAGRWPHNCNLSAKAIMGIEAYGMLARMRGETALADLNAKLARQMAQKWEADARDGDHYRLAYDRPDTWGMKYNLVWDKLWQSRVFPEGVVERELDYYLKVQQPYGLPLDCRRDYTKSDWAMWCAAMGTQEQFQALMEPIYRYVDETPTRRPVGDWHYTKTGQGIHMYARSVIGGYWMKVLMDKLHKK